MCKEVVEGASKTCQKPEDCAQSCHPVEYCDPVNKCKVKENPESKVIFYNFYNNYFII